MATTLIEQSLCNECSGILDAVSGDRTKLSCVNPDCKAHGKIFEVTSKGLTELGKKTEKKSVPKKGGK